MTDPDQWDFFVSYTQADRAWAEWIAWVLERDGHRVLVQAWDFVPGSNWVQGMHDGVHLATRTVAVLSPGYLRSVYGGAEWRAAWAADPGGAHRKLLPVRVADCERPGLLAGVVGIDVFDVGEAEARARIRRMAVEATSGTGRPSAAPAFPALSPEARFPGALPRIWNVPARNPNFTGRLEALTAIRESLTAATTVTVQAVRGMGGVGKTQLANEYAYRHATGYDVVWWIGAEEPALIPDQFATLATRLGIDPHPDPAVLREQVHDALRQVPGWLLIFDNADQAGDIRRWLPAVPLPAGLPGHALVTTRRGGFGAIGRVQELDVVDEAEAGQLMRSRVPALPAGVGDRIAEELGRLPLALEQAAAYLDHTGMSPADYLELLRTRAAELSGRGKVVSREETVATLWTLSLDRLGEENPAALHLLGLCAYLAPVPVPLDLFTEHPEGLLEPLASAAADPLAFADAVAAIVDYSLAKRDPEGLRLHRLVQGALRLRSGKEAIAEVLHLLYADVPAAIGGVPESWPRWTALLPHVLTATALCGDAAGEAGYECGWLLDGAASFLHVRGRLTEARPLLERALRLLRAVRGPDHADVAAVLANLARLTSDLGDPAAARVMGEEAVRVLENAFGAEAAVLGDPLSNLSTVLRSLGEPEPARTHAERALRITESALGPDHPAVGLRLNNLATIMLDLGEPAEARRMLERALRINEVAHVPDHPATAVTLANLAVIVEGLGDLAGARQLSERALRIDEAIYGPDHPEVGADLNNLAVLLQRLGEPAEACRLAARALRIAEASYDPGHPMLVTWRHNLAQIMGSLAAES